MKIIKLFQPRFAPAVKDGTKLNTIRPLPKRERDLPQVGWEISLREWTGKPYRSKQRVLKESVIERVQLLTFASQSIYLNGIYVTDNLGFATADGFTDFHDMYAWFSTTHGLPFSGVFIAWKA